MPIKIYNTLSGKKEVFKPLKDGQVKMYVCGMTVQDIPHIGHMRAYITTDVLRRYFEYKGFNVTIVQNFTDIEDKVLGKAKEEGIDYRILAEKNTEEYFKYADVLNIKRASFYPKSTQHIKEIVELIETLKQRGFAYITESGVYFEVAKFKDYGKLSKKKIDELKPGARIEIDEKKRSPLDFALWKASKEGEPYWDSPFGKGRPGWHIECSAMSMHYLGETFDIHCGGEDLIFPHHENEIVQSEGATGKEFARYWVHNGWVKLTGEKMSKSTGHFIAIKDIVQKYEPNVIRLFLLSTHYRKQIEYSLEAMEEANASYNRLKNLLLSLKNIVGEKKQVERNLNPEEKEVSKFVKELGKKFEDAMDDDFNTPLALGYLFDLTRSVNKIIDNTDKKGLLSKCKDALSSYLEILGFSEITAEAIGKLTPELIRLLIDTRDRLRSEKLWKLSDEIRERLLKLGIHLYDKKDGTTWNVL